MGECVLVVDDHPPMVKLIRDALEKEGYLVLSAENGAEGLRVAAAHRPDLVILDVEMPVMNGFEVLRALRLKVATGTLPVIMLTVHKDPQDLLSGWMGGADLYLTKPCRIEEVVAAVKQTLAPPAHREDELPLPFPSQAR
jgi:two-component system copper resistance phosphate regulon response regulator CusR